MHRSAWVAVVSATLLGAAPALASTASSSHPPGISPQHRLAAAPACVHPPTKVNNYAPPVSGRTVALTFDDGPGPTTQAVIDILRSERVTATFFNMGVQQQANPDVVIEEARDGFALGDHTWDHHEMTAMTAHQQETEIRRAAAEQLSILGGRPCLFRPPYGSYDATTLALTSANDMALWNWSVDIEDWKAAGSSSSYWVHRIITRAEAGASQQHPVILMHNQATPDPATVAALRPVIRYYKARHYTFVDLYGRTLLPSVAATARTASGLHRVEVAANGALREQVDAGSGAWHWLGRGFADSPAAVATGPAEMLVAAREATGDVAVREAHDGSWAGGWRRLGGSWVGRPQLAVTASGAVALVMRGLDDQAWLRERVNGRWSAWRRLGAHLLAGPAVASTGGRGLTVVGVDDGGRVVTTHRSAQRWSAWRVLGRAAPVDPALVSTASGSRLLLVTRSSRGTLQTRAWTSRDGWAARGSAVRGAVDSAPGVYLDVRMVRLFGVRGNGLSENDWSLKRGRWSGWHAA
ncbi:MAG: polysaccharide deacetylase family protein [Frankiales bacterium]|nr:polysaccharide deacetylase family protein [Frankiales bacterium]